MTTLVQSPYASGALVAPTPSEQNVCSYHAIIDLTAAQVAASTIIEMGPLPAGCTLSEIVVDVDSLDTNATPSLTFNVGLMSGTFGKYDVTRTCDATIMSGETTAQAGGVARPTLVTAYRKPVSQTDVGIGVEIITGPATAAAGNLGIWVHYTG